VINSFYLAFYFLKNMNIHIVGCWNTAAFRKLLATRQTINELAIGSWSRDEVPT
jgi:hypothetical protein